MYFLLLSLRMEWVQIGSAIYAFWTDSLNSLNSAESIRGKSPLTQAWSELLRWKEHLAPVHCGITHECQ